MDSATRKGKERLPIKKEKHVRDRDVSLYGFVKFSGTVTWVGSRSLGGKSSAIVRLYLFTFTFADKMLHKCTESPKVPSAKEQMMATPQRDSQSLKKERQEGLKRGV